MYFLIDQPVSINKIIYTGVLAFRDFELRVPAISLADVYFFKVVRKVLGTNVFLS